MKISIVTISYNQAPYLEKAIRSVINQDYPNIEYIVVDPGSTDGSREIIERYHHRIDKVILEPDRGPADGLNKGLISATGEIFGYLNADDLYLSSAFSRIVTEFKKAPDVDIVYGHGFIIDECCQIVRHFRSARFSPIRFVYGIGNVCQQSTFIRRKSAMELKGFNPLNKTCWDAELLLQLALNGYRFRKIDAYLGAFRLHKQSISGSQVFAHDYRKEIKGYFKKIKGRNMRPTDKPVFVALRILKWLEDPIGFLCRVRDMVFSSKRIITFTNQ